MTEETSIIRQLAAQYAEIANSDLNRHRMTLHKQVNDLKPQRPIVLIDEIPWPEMNIDNELTLRCRSEPMRSMECFFRKALYQWRHMPADMVLPPYFKVGKIITSSGIGFSQVFDDSLASDRQQVQAHQYVQQIRNEQDIELLQREIITYDEAETRHKFNQAGEMIGDIMPVRICGEPTGYGMGCKTWDTIVTLRGVDQALFDLIDAPEFVHKLVRKLTDIFLDKVRQYDDMGLFDGDAYYIHGTSALTHDLQPDQSHVRASAVWGRGLAQILAVVSPAMHDEFDIQYMLEAMKPFGLVYYGCCEPLDRKISILRQIPNLRKISITPWADVNLAASAIGRKYVLSSKVNPANVLLPNLDRSAIRTEIKTIVDACRQNGCACEIVLKDITSVSNRPQNLFDWQQIALDIVQQ